MSAMSHHFDVSLAREIGREDGHVDTASLAAKWDALHEAGAAIGSLAQLGAEPVDKAVATLPQRAAELGGPRGQAIARGMDDLGSVLEPGLRALLDLTGNGHDTTAAALTLWREFHTARAAILALAETE